MNANQLISIHLHEADAEHMCDRVTDFLLFEKSLTSARRAQALDGFGTDHYYEYVRLELPEKSTIDTNLHKAGTSSRREVSYHILHHTYAL